MIEIHLLFFLVFILALIFSLSVYLFKKRYDEKKSKPISGRQNKEFLKISSSESLNALKKIHKSSFQNSEYVSISGPYSRIIVTQDGSGSIEHFIDGHNMILPVNMNFTIGKNYLIEGYYNNGCIYAVVIDGKRLLDNMTSLYQLRKNGDQDKDGCFMLGWPTVIISILTHGLILFIYKEYALAEMILLNILILSLSLATIMIIEILIYTHSKKDLYEICGTVEKLDHNVASVKGIKIKGLNSSKVSTGQHIKVEGIKEKSSIALIAKKLNGQRIRKPKLDHLLIFMLILSTLICLYNLYDLHENPEYVNYISYKKSLDNQTNTVFSTCEEILNANLVEGQRIILKDTFIYVDLNNEIYLTDQPIPLYQTELNELDKIYEVGLSVLDFINYGVVDASLLGGKIDFVNEYIDSVENTNFIGKYSVPLLTEEQDYFINNCLTKENEDLLELKRKVEDNLNKSIMIEVIGSHENYENAYMNIYKGQNYYYIPAKEYIEKSLTGRSIDQLSGYIESLDEREGHKFIKINSYFNSHQSKLEDYKYVNNIYILYLLLILVLIIIMLIKIIIYINQLKQYN